MDNNSKKYVKLLSTFLLVAFILISIYVSVHIIRFINKPEQFQTYVESFGIFAPTVYCLFVILQIFFPIIPGEPMELVGGYAFGLLRGSILCLIGEAIGSIIVVAFTRRFGAKLIRLFFDKEKIEKLDKIFSSNKNISVLIILFLLPGTPKDLLCYFSGLTTINIHLLFVITSICRIPSVITSTIIGGTLNDQNYLFAAIVFVITSIISVIGINIYKKYTK